MKVFNYNWVNIVVLINILTINLNVYCYADEQTNLIDDYLDHTILNELIDPLKENLNFPEYSIIDSILPNLNVSDILGKLNEDIFLNITQLLTKYGYQSEQHEVETSDGYLLTMFRIPKADAPVVLVMHGLQCSSDDYVVTGPGHGLAYLLADAGYDVWLGNSRGTKHGRKHVTLSPDNDDEFWDFTWDEVGRYDLPVMIDYTLNKTGKNNLTYVSHSQGSTSYFVMASEKPEYTDKVSVSIILSAVVYVGNTTSLLKPLAPFNGLASTITETIGLNEYGTRNTLTDILTTVFCGTPLTAKLICYNIVAFAAGSNYEQVNATNLPVIFGHYPAGGSVKQFIHYLQNTDTGEFRRFDMGKKKNLEKYGSEIPPKYSLEKVSGKMVIFYSDNDLLTLPPDLNKLLLELANDVETYRVPLAKFTHFDFIWAKDVATLLNYKIIEYIDKYGDA